MDNVTAQTVFCNLNNGLCEPHQVVSDTNSFPVWTANVPPPTISYVAPSKTQVGGLCYIHAPIQSFQTRYAMKLDQLGWYNWGPNDLDRSILMSPVPFYQCAGHRGNVLNFMSIIGLVDNCFEPYGLPDFPASTFQPDICGYYGSTGASPPA